MAVWRFQIAIGLILTNCIIINIINVSTTELNPQGLNVCTKDLSYNEYRVVRRTIQKVESYQTCTLGAGVFGGCFLWATKTAYRTVYRLLYQSVVTLKYRRVLHCCSGYQRNGTDCSTPICEDGCLHGTCVDPNKCSCHNGYTGSKCDTDINECVTGNGGCEQVCRNTEGSFICDCRNGFTVSQTSPNKCQDVNECEVGGQNLCYCADQDNNPKCQATCVNRIGDYQCSCSEGYHTNDNRICQDINECQKANGGCSMTCVNTPGSHHCLCDVGYHLSSDNKTCVDTNECETRNGGCEHGCTNTIGGFNCSCEKGYFLDGNGRTCSDHDECKDADHGCEYKCVNMQGSYTCACKQGFKLNPDNTTCSDLNECEEMTMLPDGRKMSIAGCKHLCHNFVGSYNCSCQAGYRLLADLKTCIDYNECENNEHRCQHICTNKQGSYDCSCHHGYKVGENFYECVGERCVDIPLLSNGNSTCYTGVTGDECSFTCDKGFTLTGSRTRTCQPNHQFNGSAAVCERRNCDEISPLVNGSVILPCIPYYNATCKVECFSGYVLNGTNSRTCVVGENDEMKWTNEDVQCVESTVCFPNPCKHSGACQPVGTTYVCNCDGTGYTGKHCERGVVSVPQIPILSVNAEKENLLIQAKPDTALTVHIIGNDTNLDVTPKIVTIIYPSTFATFKLLGKVTGFFTLDYNLSNSDASKFLTPNSSVVFVNNDISKPVADIPLQGDGSIKPGCNEFDGNIIEGEVLKGVKAVSNAPFDNTGSSNGIIQIKSHDGQLLPLSATGGRFNNNEFNRFSLTHSIDSNVSEQSNNPIDGECYSQLDPKASIKQLLKTNAFLQSIQNMFNKHSPYWFKVQSGFVQQFDSADLRGDLIKGSEIRNSPDSCTKGFDVDPNAVYYIFKSRQPFNILFPTKNITLNTRIQKCFMKNIKQDAIYFAMVPLNIESFDQIKNVSDELNIFLQTTGTTDRIGFMKNNILKQINIQTNGFRSIGPIDVDGKQIWTTNSQSEILKNGQTDIKQDRGTAAFNLSWKVMNIIQGVNGNGTIMSFARTQLTSTDVCQNGTASTVNFTKAHTTLSGKISKLVSFNTDSSIFVYTLDQIQHGPATLEANITELSIAFNRLKSKVIELQQFFTNLHSEESTVNDLKQAIMKKLNILKNDTDSFTNDINAQQLPSVAKLSRRFATIRDALMDVHKRFDIFGIEYAKSAGFDIIDFYDTMNDFKSFLITFNEILNKFKISIPPPIRLTKLAHIKSTGMVCLAEGYCYKNISNELSYGSHITQCIGGNTELSRNSTVIISKLTNEDDFGGLFKLAQNDWISTVIGADTETYRHDFKSTWQYYSKESSVADVKISSNGDVKITSKSVILGDDTDITISASIKGQSKEDPIQFLVRGSIATNQKLGKEIKAAVRRNIDAIEMELDQRYENLRKDIKSHSADIQHYTFELDVNKNDTMNMKSEISALEESINKTENEITRFKQSLQDSPEAEIVSIKNFYNECQPSLCLPTCIPGVVVSMCQAKQDVYIMEQKCKFANTTRQRVDYNQKSVQNSQIELESEISCATKCPPLARFLRKITGDDRSRRRKSFVNGIAVVTLVKTFHKAGGTEGAIGALIGGAVAGPVGGVVGGVIGSAFGSCDKRCNTIYVPRTKFYNIVTIEREVLNYTELTSKCDNVIKSYKMQGEVSSCLKNSTCSNVRHDSECTRRQKQCTTRATEIQQMHNKSIYDERYMKYQRDAYQLDLLKKRRDILHRSLQGKIINRDIVNNTLVLLISNLRRTQNKEKEFNESFGIIRQSMEEYKNKKGDIIINNITYTHSTVYGSRLPKSLLLSLHFNDTGPQYHQISALFDMTRTNESIHDAAILTTHALFPSLVMTKGRSRRSLSRHRGSLHYLQSQCLQVESAVLFLTNFIMALQKEVNAYSLSKLTEDSGSRDIQRYLDTLENMTAEVSLSSKDFESSLRLLRNDFSLLQSTSNTNWSLSHTRFLVAYSKLLQNQTDCYSLVECIFHKLTVIESLFKYGDSSGVNDIRKDIKRWLEVFPKFLDTSVSFEVLKKMVADTYLTFINTHAVAWYCGQPPVLNGSLSGEPMHLREGDDLIITLTVRNKLHETDFEWWYDRTVVPNQYNGTLKISSINTKQAGWYSCKATNKFGTTECGVRKVIVYPNPTVSIAPSSINIYDKSPEIEYLRCNATNANSISWFYQPFSSSIGSPVVNLPYTDSTLTIRSDDQEFQTGNYWCEVSNRMSTTTSSKISINRLVTTMAIERVEVSFKVKVMNSATRRRRSTMPNKMSINEIQQLKIILADSMNTTVSSIQNLKYSNTGEVTFVLRGKDFTIDLLQSKTWESVSSKILKDRENILLRTVLLYYNVNKTFQFRAEGKEVVAIPGSLTTNALDPKCKEGLVLNDNGFTCGACPAGTRYENNACIPCEKGTIQPSPSQNTCIRCPGNGETLSTGSVSAEYCIEISTTSSPKTTSTATNLASTLAPRNATLPTAAPEKDTMLIIIIAVVVCVLVIIVIGIVIGIVCRRRKRNLKPEEEKRRNNPGHTNPTFDVNDASMPVEENPYQMIDADFRNGAYYSTIPDMKAKVSNSNGEDKGKKERPARLNNQYEHTNALAFNNFAFRGESVKSNQSGAYDVLNRDSSRKAILPSRSTEKRSNTSQDRQQQQQSYEKLGVQSKHYQQI